MAGGPFYRQVLHGTNPIFRYWRMFAGGRDFVDVRFWRRLPDGAEEPIDRFALLGYGHPRGAPASVRWIHGERRLHETVRRLCEALGPEADLRARSRTATDAGWVAGYTGQENLYRLEEAEVEAP